LTHSADLRFCVECICAPAISLILYERCLGSAIPVRRSTYTIVCLLLLDSTKEYLDCCRMESTKKATPNPNLLVLGLPATMSEAALEALFARAGPVKSAKHMIDVATGRSRGFGFVLFERTEDAVRAKTMLEGVSVHGDGVGTTSHPMHIEFAYHDAFNVVAPNERVFVRNIPREARHADVLEFFSSFGEVEACRLRQEGRAHGQDPQHQMAVVRFKDLDGARRAVQEAGGQSMLPGKAHQLFVKYAETPDVRKERRNRQKALDHSTPPDLSPRPSEATPSVIETPTHGATLQVLGHAQPAHFMQQLYSASTPAVFPHQPPVLTLGPTAVGGLPGGMFGQLRVLGPVQHVAIPATHGTHSSQVLFVPHHGHSHVSHGGGGQFHVVGDSAPMLHTSAPQFVCLQQPAGGAPSFVPSPFRPDPRFLPQQDM
jgi:hypothetical protein